MSPGEALLTTITTGQGCCSLLHLSNAPLDLSNEAFETSNGPFDLTNTPLDASKSPLDLSNEPLDVSKSPLDLSNEPLDASKSPLDLSNEPLYASKFPLDLSNGPLDVSKSPLDPSNEPLDLSEERDGPQFQGLLRSGASREPCVRVTCRRGAPAGGFEVAQLQPVFGEAAQIGLSDRSKRWWRRLAGRMTSGSSDLPATIATNEALGQISSASSRAR